MKPGDTDQLPIFRQLTTFRQNNARALPDEIPGEQREDACSGNRLSG
jgi:hypothetical protein